MNILKNILFIIIILAVETWSHLDLHSKDTILCVSYISEINTLKKTLSTCKGEVFALQTSLDTCNQNVICQTDKNTRECTNVLAVIAAAQAKCDLEMACNPCKTGAVLGAPFPITTTKLYLNTDCTAAGCLSDPCACINYTP